MLPGSGQHCTAVSVGEVWGLGHGLEWPFGSRIAEPVSQPCLKMHLLSISDNAEEHVEERKTFVGRTDLPNRHTGGLPHVCDHRPMRCGDSRGHTRAIWTPPHPASSLSPKLSFQSVSLGVWGPAPWWMEGGQGLAGQPLGVLQTAEAAGGSAHPQSCQVAGRLCCGIRAGVLETFNGRALSAWGIINFPEIA
jgi:hypothetical protein